MNKFLVALCFTLAAVATAQDCTSDFYAALPALQKIYMDYNSKNWAAIEGDLERLIPTARDILAHCANVSIPDSPALNACIEDSKSIARLLVPLIVDSTNQTALINLMVQLPQLAGHIYATCIKPNTALELFAAADEFDTEDFSLNSLYSLYSPKSLNSLNSFNSLKGMIECAGNVTALYPDINQFVADMDDFEPVHVISQDLMAILNHTNNVCDACNIPRPSVHVGPADIENCLLGAQKLVDLAQEVLSAKFNIQVALQKLSALVDFLPTAVSQCQL